MNTAGKALVIIAAIATPVVALVVAVIRLTDRTIRAIDAHYGDAFWLVLAVFLALALASLVTGGVVAKVRAWNCHIHARNGLFPILTSRTGIVNLNETGAQTLAAVAGASGRVSAPMAGRVIDHHYRAAQPVALPQPELPAPAQQSITVRDVVGSINPRTSPHWLLIGTTGSGKTSASYSILQEMGRRAPCEFMITEPGGVNWGSQAIATRSKEISDVIIHTNREMERRQDTLRAEDVDHIEDLREPPPYLVLVAEEMDAVLDELRLTDLDRRKQTLVALRAIARMGRKPGVCLVAVSQSGTTDVFDNHVRKNMGNVLLFRSEHTVNEMWRIPAKLSELPQGAAYSVHHAAVVQFPHVQRPQLAAAQADVIDGVYRYTEPKTDHDSSIPVFDTADRSGYTPAQAAHIRSLYNRLGSIKAVERQLYNQDGGYWFYRIQETINA
jgi:hypothetical protein